MTSMHDTLRMDIWVRDPAQPDKHAYIDTDKNENGNEMSLIYKGDKWEMFLKDDDDFSSVLWACNLHLKETCISPCHAHQKVGSDVTNHQPPPDSINQDVASDKLDDANHQPPPDSINQDVASDKLDVAKVVKTARLLCQLDNNLGKAVRAYSEKIVSPYPRVVFQGLFEAAEIATCRKDDYHREAKVISDTTKIKRSTVDVFKEMNNRLKHPDVRCIHKDPSLKDVSNAIENFRPKVTELLLKRVWSAHQAQIDMTATNTPPH